MKRHRVRACHSTYYFGMNVSSDLSNSYGGVLHHVSSLPVGNPVGGVNQCKVCNNSFGVAASLWESAVVAWSEGPAHTIMDRPLSVGSVFRGRVWLLARSVTPRLVARVRRAWTERVSSLRRERWCRGACS